MPKQSRGIKTYERIVRRAAQLASAEGLDGLTVGKLASALGLSKGGLFAHFGSKDALQLAVVEEARRIFQAAVIDPSEQSPEGLPRLFALQMNWIAYLRANTFRGGCFFAAASLEFDGRPGAVRARIAALAGQWRERLAAEARRAKDLVHLDEHCDPARLAFLLHAVTLEANWAHQLLNDNDCFDHAREISEAAVRAHATRDGLRATKTRRVVPASTTSIAV
jgi:AcrR family transcriptional regulator